MIGRRIDALERRLGVRLMHRSTRRLALTEQGAVYLEHCRRLLADLEQVESAIGEGRHKATGHLVVSAPAAFGRKHVAPHGPAFVAQNPDVRVSFDLTDQVVDLVRLGFDLGVRIGGVIDPDVRRDQARGQPARRLRDARRTSSATACRARSTDLARHNCLAFNLQGGQQGGWHFRHRRQAGHRARRGQSRLQRQRAAASLDLRGPRALVAVDVGDRSASSRAASSSPCSTTSRCRPTTSWPSIRSSATCRRRCASSSSTSSVPGRHPATGSASQLVAGPNNASSRSLAILPISSRQRANSASRVLPVRRRAPQGSPGALFPLTAITNGKPNFSR